ncbi:MAG: cupin domain-containing protein [Cyanobacteriota bacterium]|nr:cupin domain-containing protein [Cyanobacteriota bacterium]
MPDSSQNGVAAPVEQLGLQPHPEGGWYREIHRSALEVERWDGQKRSALTLIWFLLHAQEISRWHRVIGAEETWHHAGGDPLELWLLPPAGGVAQRRVLGPMNREGGQPVHVVPAGWWQAARCLGDWTLVNCCVAPGFDFQDFELLYQQPASGHPPGALSELW